MWKDAALSSVINGSSKSPDQCTSSFNKKIKQIDRNTKKMPIMIIAEKAIPYPQLLGDKGIRLVQTNPTDHPVLCHTPQTC